MLRRGRLRGCRGPRRLRRPAADGATTTSWSSSRGSRMRRPSAYRTWIAYRAVEAFAFALGWTVAPSSSSASSTSARSQLVLAGTALEVAYFALRDPDRHRGGHVRPAALDHRSGSWARPGFVATGLANGVWLVLVAAAVHGLLVDVQERRRRGLGHGRGRGRERRPLVPGAARRRCASARWSGSAPRSALALVDLRLPIVAGGVALLALAMVLVAVMPETGFVSARAESVSAVAVHARNRQTGRLAHQAQPAACCSWPASRSCSAPRTRASTGSGRRSSSSRSASPPSAGSTRSCGSACSQPARRCSRSSWHNRCHDALAAEPVRHGEDAARLRLAADRRAAGLRARNVLRRCARRLLGGARRPLARGARVSSTWLNANVEDSRVRATVLSMTNVFGSAGEWGGGPGARRRGQRLRDPRRARRRARSC